MTATAFDALATDYDATFTDTSLGRRYRNAVWRRVDQRFSTGQHVLEVNCGTGEDARHLAQRGVGVIATDVSQAMVDLAAAKLEEFDHASARQLAIEAVGGTFEPASFDGVLSNFGGLNCVDDLAAAAAGLAGVVRPGGLALVCLMGPFVPWEIAW